MSGMMQILSALPLSMSQRTPWLAFACLAASTSLIGSYVGLSTLLVAVFPVFLLAWLRFGLAAVMMGGWVKRGANEPALDGRSRWLLFWESFLGNFLFSICLLYGLKGSSAVVAGVVMAGIPAAVAGLSWLVLKERIALRVLLGIALGVAGIALVALSQNGEQEAGSATPSSTAIGTALLICAVLCEASYVVIGKQLTTARVSPKRISALINLWGLALVTPLGLWQALRFDFSAPSLSIWGLMLFYAAAASMVTVWLWMTGLRQVPAAKAGVFMVFLPITTAIVGLLLGERMSMTQALAYGLALGGVVLATWPPRATSRHLAPTRCNRMSAMSIPSPRDPPHLSPATDADYDGWLAWVTQFAALLRAPSKPAPLRLAPDQAQAPGSCLIFAPHPDDECIVGALPLRLRQEAGWQVTNVAVTLGSNLARQQARWQELENACAVLGFGNIRLNRDGFEEVKTQTAAERPALWAAQVQAVAALLADQKPALILLPHAGDGIATHMGTHLLVTQAVAVSGLTTMLAETEFWATMTAPNCLVECSNADTARLVQALACHVGEVERNPYHLRLPAFLADSVRRGGELMTGAGSAPPNYAFATLYRLTRWQAGQPTGVCPTRLCPAETSLTSDAFTV